ncbi:YheU family protein [Salinivibrio sp. IB643]|jgi:Uncharacterized protein conserved in bacteria|uniref:YheU family protein n=1 Tax=Salinivibrio TaxID=51366 RepID=UPI000988B251|nr:YheU family protein [Salinivibrio sp. IB643]OOE97621.1 hypothetical protein BZG77_08355 [Salinivibrio sp. IB643]
MMVPWQSVPEETLTRLIEHFVLREGTDYGEREVSFAQKVADVRQQLQSGDAVIVYSELHETVDIRRKEALRS